MHNIVKKQSFCLWRQFNHKNDDEDMHELNKVLESTPMDGQKHFDWNYMEKWLFLIPKKLLSGSHIKRGHGEKLEHLHYLHKQSLFFCAHHMRSWIFMVLILCFAINFQNRETKIRVCKCSTIQFCKLVRF